MFDFLFFPTLSTGRFALKGCYIYIGLFIIQFPVNTSDKTYHSRKMTIAIQLSGIRILSYYWVLESVIDTFCKLKVSKAK